MQLKEYTNKRIYREREKIYGLAVSAPYLKTLGNQAVWVLDVLIHSDSELMESMPIAENNRQIRNFVTEGTPIEIQRSSTGFFYVSGLANKEKGSVNKKTYKLADYNLGFAEGWKLDSSGDYETGNGNAPSEGTATTTEKQYIFETIIYGDLTYGVTPYGSKKYTRI